MCDEAFVKYKVQFTMYYFKARPLFFVLNFGF